MYSPHYQPGRTGPSALQNYEKSNKDKFFRNITIALSVMGLLLLVAVPTSVFLSPHQKYPVSMIKDMTYVVGAANSAREAHERKMKIFSFLSAKSSGNGGSAPPSSVEEFGPIDPAILDENMFPVYKAIERRYLEQVNSCMEIVSGCERILEIADIGNESLPDQFNAANLFFSDKDNRTRWDTAVAGRPSSVGGCKSEADLYHLLRTDISARTGEAERMNEILGVVEARGSTGDNVTFAIYSSYEKDQPHSTPVVVDDPAVSGQQKVGTSKPFIRFIEVPTMSSASCETGDIARSRMFQLPASDVWERVKQKTDELTDEFGRYGFAANMFYWVGGIGGFAGLSMLIFAALIGSKTRDV